MKKVVYTNAESGYREFILETLDMKSIISDIKNSIGAIIAEFKLTYGHKIVKSSQTSLSERTLLADDSNNTLEVIVDNQLNYLEVDFIFMQNGIHKSATNIYWWVWKGDGLYRIDPFSRKLSCAKDVMELPESRYSMKELVRMDSIDPDKFMEQTKDLIATLHDANPKYEDFEPISWDVYKDESGKWLMAGYDSSNESMIFPLDLLISSDSEVEEYCRLYDFW